MTRKLFFYVSLFLCPILAAQDFKVLSSTPNSLIIEFTPVYTDTIINVKEGINYFEPVFLFGEISNAGSIGEAKLIQRVFNVGVPNEFGNTIQVIESNFTTLNGLLAQVPFPEEKYKLNTRGKELLQSNYGSVQNEIVSFGSFGLVRNLPVQQIVISPVLFDLESRNIKIYNRIVFRVNFSTPSGEREIVSSELLSGMVLNFNAAKNWALKRTKRTDNELEKTTISGDWHRFPVYEEGIYKIERSNLQNFGIDPNTVDPRTIKIYNNGGYLLSEQVEKPRPQGFLENAILVVGEDDGRFDDGDYILFYGRGITFFEFQPDSGIAGKISRNRHWYSRVNYYWISSGGSFGKRMDIENSLQQNNPIQQNTTKRFIWNEHDDVNLLKSGKMLFGDEITASERSRTFVNMLNHLVPNTTINYDFQYANFSATSNDFWPTLTVDENGTVIHQQIWPGSDGAWRKGWEDRKQTVFNGTLPENRSVLKFTSSNTFSDISGFVDFFTITYDSYLNAVSDSLMIFTEGQDGVIEFTAKNFSNSNNNIFDLTDFANVKKINPPANWISGGQIKFQAQNQTNEVRKYFVVNVSRYKTPNPAEVVSLAGLRDQLTGVEHIIITNKVFSESANRLKTFRSSQARHQHTSNVFYVDDIYQEFSCGMQDPTAIRDFIKFAYDNWSIEPNYVLLLGDGDYDYFNLDGYGLNYVPTFQTKNSLHELGSYPYDDFYARISGDDLKADIAIGRLPIQSNDDADRYIDKLLFYETQVEKGLWRNLITLVADDGLTSDGDDQMTHTRQSEELDQRVIPESFNKNKIYLANYPAVITSAGRRKPEVNDAIVNAINNGTLILNFIGHGNPKVWAHEVVFDRTVNIPLLDNEKYFFLTAATCDYGKFDDPIQQSASEEMLFLERRGMIGGFSASRPVYSGQNAALNEEFYRNLFTRADDKLPKAVGIAYMETKAKRTNINDEKFHLFADPAMRLNEPESQAQIDKLNGQSPDISIQVSALSSTSIEGKVLKSDGTIDADFNGEAIIAVFDSERKVDLPEISYWMNVEGGVIFKGRVSVVNGLFSTNFTVPKDISYENNRGKIVAYFLNEQKDGIGFTNEFRVGGTDTSAVNDQGGPEIEIYFDDVSFENSYLVNSNFTLIVKLIDDTGLNTTGTGVGHKLEAILNEDEDNAIDLSNYFVGDLDAGGKSGTVNYRFTNLDPGEYKIKIKAWDVFNNNAEEEKFFSVVSGDELVVRNVVNYPNPFNSETTFTMQHNSNNPIDVRILIYTIAGRKIKEISKQSILERFVKIPWDGRDADGNLIANGTYLYKVIVESQTGEFKENILGKLAVIR